MWERRCDSLANTVYQLALMLSIKRLSRVIPLLQGFISL